MLQNVRQNEQKHFSTLYEDAEDILKTWCSIRKLLTVQSSLQKKKSDHRSFNFLIFSKVSSLFWIFCTFEPFVSTCLNLFVVLALIYGMQREKRNQTLFLLFSVTVWSKPQNIELSNKIVYSITANSWIRMPKETAYSFQNSAASSLFIVDE